MVHKIVGAAGAGKTSLLLKLLKKHDTVAFLSFTKAAIAEAKRRVKNTNTEYFRTLHSLCYKLLGVRSGQMLDFKLMNKFRESMGEIGYEITFFFDEDNHDERKSIPLYLNQLSVNLMKPIEDVYTNHDVSLKDVKYVIRCYNDFKKYYKVMDFNDLLSKTLELKDFDVPKTVFIDEAQDLTVLQWEVFSHIFKDADNKYIVGDDCQCLYHWAGVDMNNFIDLKYDKLTKLNKSYRVPANILKVSNKIYNRIEKKIDREINTVADGGKLDIINSLEYYDFKSNESYFILLRNWYFNKKVIDVLNNKGVPYLMDKKSSVNPKDVKAIYNWERVRLKKEKPDIKLLSEYANGLSNKPWFEAFTYMDLDKAVYYRNILRNGFSLTKINIEISTIHRSKGREADNVILFQDVSSKTFDNIDSDSEHKVFYVGVTRAKKSLTLVSPSTLKYYEVKV